MTSFQAREGFWREAIALHGSVTLQVMPSIVYCGIFASAACILTWYLEDLWGLSVSIDISPFAFAGVVLGLLLVIRLNAGYDRWWEARILWGGIVNQTRNLVISALAYGPSDTVWRDRIVRWTAVFPHAVRSSLRHEVSSDEASKLIGQHDAALLMAAEHMPSFVALRIAELLVEAKDRFELDRFAFLQIDKERASLIDHLGGCERILATPLPRIYSITIRRFILLFILMLPIALFHQLDAGWLTPIITMLLAYPLLALDQIGVELENPFSKSNLSHLPLDEISEGIEVHLLGLLKTIPRDDSANKISD